MNRLLFCFVCYVIFYFFSLLDVQQLMCFLPFSKFYEFTPYHVQCTLPYLLFRVETLFAIFFIHISLWRAFRLLYFIFYFSDAPTAISLNHFVRAINFTLLLITSLIL